MKIQLSLGSKRDKIRNNFDVIPLTVVKICKQDQVAIEWEENNMTCLIHWNYQME
jgi:hypothetical protein